MDLRKKKNFIINCLYASIIIIIISLVLKYGLTIISPFLIAFIISYFISSLSNFISKKTKLRYKFTSFILVFIFYLCVGLIITFIGIKSINFLIEIISKLPEVYSKNIEPSFRNSFEELKQVLKKMDPSIVDTLNNMVTQITQTVGETIKTISLKAVDPLSNYAVSIPSFLIKALLCIISTFFITIDYKLITDFIMKQFTENGNKLFAEIRDYIIGTLLVCIRSYALIMTITFSELSIGLSIIGIKNSILVALGISIFDVLPILGTGGIMIPWIIITFISGNFNQAIGLLILYVIITVIRNILEPKIVGAQIGLHPIVTLTSMFMGAQIFGIIGLFGFPITLSLLNYLNKKGTIKLFNK